MRWRRKQRPFVGRWRQCEAAEKKPGNASNQPISCNHHHHSSSTSKCLHWLAHRKREHCRFVIWRHYENGQHRYFNICLFVLSLRRGSFPRHRGIVFVLFCQGINRDVSRLLRVWAIQNQGVWYYWVALGSGINLINLPSRRASIISRCYRNLQRVLRKRKRTVLSGIARRAVCMK